MTRVPPGRVKFALAERLNTLFAQHRLNIGLIDAYMFQTADGYWRKNDVMRWQVIGARRRINPEGKGQRCFIGSWDTMTLCTQAGYCLDLDLDGAFHIEISAVNQ